MEACPPLFSFLFFFMLVLLATSSVAGSWEVLVGSINDQWPHLAKKRYLTMPATCLVGFLAGLPMCFDSGFFLFQVSACICTIKVFFSIHTIKFYIPFPAVHGHNFVSLASISEIVPSNSICGVYN